LIYLQHRNPKNADSSWCALCEQSLQGDAIYKDSRTTWKGVARRSSL